MTAGSDVAEGAVGEPGGERPPSPEAHESDVDRSGQVGAGNASLPAERSRWPWRSYRVSWRRPVALLLAVALVLVGLGTWFTLEAHSLRTGGPAANRALADPTATAEVTAQVTRAVQQIFSYSPERMGTTERDAAAVLRGPARESYDRLFGQVRRRAPEQRLTLTTRVVASAVRELTPKRATLLVFCDQEAVRGDTGTTSTAAAQLTITAEHHDNRWLIVDLAPR
ncbi:Mce-associated membrane protein [Amycolatopsis arida]|uniref:Mce-associated membrane protein n=1 Tax=Amycolatopsis arida TaxID=587909 RepID=A0A1I5K6B7_9PSEU|nr:hypothetical protein [Amycolatopsis arida]TDX96905.1 Mce-associated membrane protein [Amycolatopsis arida]SFO80569.1 Mce-associated membrane protein [Amycolatopsis arida]